LPSSSRQTASRRSLLPDCTPARPIMYRRSWALAPAHNRGQPTSRWSFTGHEGRLRHHPNGPRAQTTAFWRARTRARRRAAAPERSMHLPLFMRSHHPRPYFMPFSSSVSSIRPWPPLQTASPCSNKTALRRPIGRRHLPFSPLIHLQPSRDPQAARPAQQPGPSRQRIVGQRSRFAHRIAVQPSKRQNPRAPKPPLLPAYYHCPLRKASLCGVFVRFQIEWLHLWLGSPHLQTVTRRSRKTSIWCNMKNLG
jgi:hypothetical protein